MSHLPSHREVFTALINALCASSNPTLPPASIEPQERVTLQGAIPPSRRQFLLTLHVVFPLLLLPALDLLDRNLITCLTVDSGADNTSPKPSKVYHVKSLAATLPPRKKKLQEDLTYIVRLEAWNCTCVGFALDAYGAAAGSHSDASASKGGPLGGFGGLGRDGLAGGDVPCCKHLLACLLVENWPAVIHNRVEDRLITAEELAGIIAGT